MAPGTQARPRSSGGSTRSGPATIGRSTAHGDAARLLEAATANRPSSQPASEPARRTTVDALRRSQAAMLQGQGPATASFVEERASKHSNDGHRVPLPVAWFSRQAQAGEKRPPEYQGRKFAGWESSASVQLASPGSPESKMNTPTPQGKDTTYGSTFTDFSGRTEALKPAETIYHAKAEFDQWLASVGGDPRRTVSAAALRAREGETENRQAYRAWTEKEMADARGSSQFLEERSRAAEEVRRLAAAQTRQRGEEARARQSAATAATATASAATSSVAAATPALPKAAWATATMEETACGAASTTQQNSTLNTLIRPSSAPAARKVAKDKPPSEVNSSSHGSIPSVVPEIKAMLFEAAAHELGSQEQKVSQPVSVCGSEAASCQCGSKDAPSEKSACKVATADMATENTLRSSADKRRAFSIASRSTAAASSASAASDDGWAWTGQGNAGLRPQTADSVSSLGASASAAGRPRTASSGMSQPSQASSVAGSAASRARSAASGRSEASLRKMLEKANGGKVSKGSKSASSVGAASASQSSVRGAAYKQRPASVATSRGTW
eukprot:TRINITY_DN41891_c0_g1_i1.p1 TRINITY_DN41891_c0_g1~~TRINITY_DN41891_c0_g1_i1.p1  ORF type:complete len:560 (-),score=110.61 TRINITY_DN41891_c0_g1_i1:86-1765(-)